MLSPTYQHCAPEILERPSFVELKVSRKKVGNVDGDKWQKAMQIMDPTRLLRKRVKFQVINRACFKLFELLRYVPENLSVNKCMSICEAPGGFMQTLSLQFPDSFIMGFSLRGKDAIDFSPSFPPEIVPQIPNDGNIYKEDTRKAIVTCVGEGEVDLITGDGGISQDSDLENAEQNSLKLLVAQLLVILSAQREGGSFVLKIFEGSTIATIDVYRCIEKVYTDVHLCKPHSSRATNSERYIVANGYNRSEGSKLHTELNKICKILDSTRSYLYSLVDGAPTEQDIKAFDQLANAQKCALENTFQNIVHNNEAIFHKHRSRTYDEILKVIPKNLLQ